MVSGRPFCHQRVEHTCALCAVNFAIALIIGFPLGSIPINTPRCSVVLQAPCRCRCLRGRLERGRGLTCCACCVQVAPPAFLPLPGPRGWHQRGRGLVLFLNSRGELTAFSPHGQRLWQVRTLRPSRPLRAACLCVDDGRRSVEKLP